MASPTTAEPSTAPAQLQRQAAGEEPDEKPVQSSFVERAEGEEVEEEPSSVGGRPVG